MRPGMQRFVTRQLFFYIKAAVFIDDDDITHLGAEKWTVRSWETCDRVTWPVPSTKPHKPCDCDQLLNCCPRRPRLTPAIPFPSPAAKRLSGGMIVLLPFLRGHVFVVSSFLYNLMPDFLLPSAHLSETFLPGWSDPFPILREAPFGRKVSRPHPQPCCPSAAAGANSRITRTCFAGFLLPLSPSGRYWSLPVAACLLAFDAGFRSWNADPKLAKWNKREY